MSNLIQSFIPKKLMDVNHVWRDIDRITKGDDTKDLYYQTVTGLNKALPAVKLIPESTSEPELSSFGLEVDANCCESTTDVAVEANCTNPDTETESDTSDESSSDTQDKEGKGSDTKQKAIADRRAARKENKEKVKEEKREARKTKIPKAVKKRKQKMAKANAKK